MKEQLQHALVDSLEYLMSLVKENIRPEEAKTRLNLLQKQYPETKMNLLWEEPVYDYSLHYDTLLHLVGQGTISLSFCPESTLPWPMRGVHRWSEGDLVRVNNTVLKVVDALANLDFIWDERKLMNHLIDTCIIHETISKKPIEISNAELQQSMNAFRKAHKLYTAEETYRWMEEQGMTHEKFETLVIERARIAKLRNRITTDAVEDYFEKHRADFETASIARWDCDLQQTAWETWEQIRRGEVDFYEAAQNSFLAAVERRSHDSWKFFSMVQRGQTSLDLSKAIFTAEPGQILEPLPTGDGYAMIRVLSFAPAHLDYATRGVIKDILFEEWLAQHREAATIEWYWG